jgi:hypothetical protein
MIFLLLYVTRIVINFLSRRVRCVSRPFPSLWFSILIKCSKECKLSSSLCNFSPLVFLCLLGPNLTNRLSLWFWLRARDQIKAVKTVWIKCYKIFILFLLKYHDKGKIRFSKLLAVIFGCLTQINKKKVLYNYTQNRLGFLYKVKRASAKTRWIDDFKNSTLKIFTRRCHVVLIFLSFCIIHKLTSPRCCKYSTNLVKIKSVKLRLISLN